MQQSKFQGLMVKLASNETIENWSNGSIEHADTINYRTGKPKPKGLFCESIFGPVKNYECSCGKYKGVRYKGIVCERCGVEVTSSRVRRSRMGHIDLASPVIHIRYQNSTAGGIHHLLGISGNEIKKILGFVKYVIPYDVQEDQRRGILQSLDKDYASSVEELQSLYEEEKKEYEKTKQKKSVLKNLEKRFEENKKSLQLEFNRVKSLVADFDKGTTIVESDYRNIFYKFEKYVTFKSGPQAIYEMLKNFDVRKHIKQKLAELRTMKSKIQKKKLFSVIKLLVNLYASGVEPRNMILKKLPVIPPDLRPVVQLDGGKFASSDVNLFYRRVLMRNLRLKKMIQVGMPEVVKKNEIRLLQESVNNLFVGEKGNTSSAAGAKVFKSLSDMVSGKEGVFRKNLLGKRVDYSGRSVISVGPKLTLDECGIPLYIAIRMFSPFIIQKLIEKNIVYTPKQAEKIIKDEDPVALELLEEVIQDKYVLLNRAPTLHRLSIEAFKVKLVQGKTIRIHPLVCGSFNADFDGDQMAVHLPLSDEAQKEARELIAATENILKPASGEPTIAHSQDMILGIYYITDDQRKKGVDLGYFSTVDDVLELYNKGEVTLHDKVTLVFQGKPDIETTVGRCVFNNILPKEIPFVNETIGKKPLKKLLNTIFDRCGKDESIVVADQIKNLGFSYSTLSTTTLSMTQINVPKELEDIKNLGNQRANQVYTLYFKGLLSEEEKHRLIVESRTEIKSNVENEVKKSLGPGDDLYTMVDSGAKGSYTNTTQISGMKGLVLNPQGEVIELPIKGNYLQGLNPIEYFVSIHSSRKGKADTALKTAESGYLTRKLCDAGQEVIIREEDCGTTSYDIVSLKEVSLKNISLEEKLYGRVLAKDVYGRGDKKILDAGTMLFSKEIDLIEDSHVEYVYIRTPLTCVCSKGVCQKCYGMDLATRKIVDIGSPVGIIAAQSIGEPATQLTMRTFHAGGTQVGQGDMTQGIDRVKQLFEVRTPKNPAIVAPFDGEVELKERGKKRYLLLHSDYEEKLYLLKDGYSLTIKEGEDLTKGSVYAVKGKSKLKTKESGKVLSIQKDRIIIGISHTTKHSLTGLSPYKQSGKMMKGEILTTGPLDIEQYQSVVGDFGAQKYIIDEIKKLYMSQGQSLHDKHIEVVVKQLFSKVFIKNTGDSSFIPGTYVNYEEYLQVNKKLEEEGKKKAIGQRIPQGLTNIAKQTDSRLSAASFQETIRVMVGASLEGAVDELNDLKSNVIIGRLLPIGENYRNTQEIVKD